MKALVTDMSSTSNTKKVADAMYSELAYKKEMKRVEDIEDHEELPTYLDCFQDADVGENIYQFFI